MQLPGMSTEPVRVVLEVTWWPSSNDWGIARKGWRRDSASTWCLEEMSTSGSPLSRSDLLTVLAAAYDNLVTEILQSDDPFSTTGAFH